MNTNTNTVKIPTKSRFKYIPKNEEEKQHLNVLEDILKDKRSGDWKLVGEMISISSASAEKAFFRVYQKHHFDVVEALKVIIEKRKELLIK